MLVYDLIKEKVPIINFVKKRDNNEFLIIFSKIHYPITLEYCLT